MADKRWYIVHTYAGMEQKAKANLEQKVSSMNMEDQVCQILIPEKDLSEPKGKKDKNSKQAPKKLFPGYIIVEMQETNENVEFVRTTPGVTGFVTIGKKAVPLEPMELDSIFRQMGITEDEKKQVDIEVEIGQRARILEGPFAESYGVIQEVDNVRGKVKLAVNIFNRETTVEVNIEQIEEI